MVKKSDGKSKKRKTNKKAWFIGALSVAIVIVGFIAFAKFLISTDNNEGKMANGSKAPGFTLASTQGDISLSDYKGKNVVIYFYEGNG